MVFRQCFCDPYKLTYWSAIFTAIEAVAFGTLNIVLICMYKCVLEPPEELHFSFDWFWAWYFYDEGACAAKEGYTPPEWINANYTIDPRPSQTTPEANYSYQISYLVLHAAWFISAFLLIYGNARKITLLYVPWLLVSLTLIIMDVVIASFYIADIVTVTKLGTGYRSAMFWILAMYWRLFIIWFINLNKLANACNAFRKTYPKRSKQARQLQAHQKRVDDMAKRLAQAEAAAARATQGAPH